MKIKSINMILLEAKHVVFFITLPMLPFTRLMIIPYLILGIIICFGIHSIWPNSVEVKLSKKDWTLIYLLVVYLLVGFY